MGPHQGPQWVTAPASSMQRPWAHPHGLPDPRAVAPLVWYSVGRQQGWQLLLQLRGPKDTPRLLKPTLPLLRSCHSGCRVSISCC